MKELAIGIDIGGTNTRIALSDREGNISCSSSFSTANCHTADAFIGELCSHIGSIFAENEKILGIGIGAPNANHAGGYIEKAPNLPWKERLYLAKILIKKFNTIALIDNDANAIAFGEKVFGKAKELDNFISITLGTGVGSGVFVNGKILYGASGMAGEIGHICIDENGRKCNCGKLGCFERYCSAPGLVITANELNPARSKPYAHSAEVYNDAVKGDTMAIEAFKVTGKLLGMHLANTAHITSPSHIFIAGGLSKASDFFWQDMQDAFNEQLLESFRAVTKIELSALNDNDDSSILGATAMVFNR